MRESIHPRLQLGIAEAQLAVHDRGLVWVKQNRSPQKVIDKKGNLHFVASPLAVRGAQPSARSEESYTRMASRGQQPTPASGSRAIT